MASIHDLLKVYSFEKKIRLGDNKDGGYVICDLDGKYDCYISCGISDEASFDRDFLNKYKYIGKDNSFAFDGTIEDYPYKFTNNINFIKKNIATFNDDKNTNLDYLINKYEKIFLSIDIEGGEYEYILSLTDKYLQKFKQICIEVHGLCNNGCSTRYKNKLKCLDKLNKTHYIMHAHGNNYSNKYCNRIPNVLELTYVNKKCLSHKPIQNTTPLPIKGLDYPNKPSRKDCLLNGYPFTDKHII